MTEYYWKDSEELLSLLLLALTLFGGTEISSYSVGPNKITMESYYRSINEQAGIYSREGGFDIYVEGNTGLKGAVISSEADGDKNKLSTGTLSFSDIENEAEWESSKTGINVGLGKGTENKDKGIAPNIEGSADFWGHYNLCLVWKRIVCFCQRKHPFRFSTLVFIMCLMKGV